MKVTVELETDKDRELAKRFLDKDETPIVVSVSDSKALKVLLILKQSFLTDSKEKARSER